MKRDVDRYIKLSKSKLIVQMHTIRNSLAE